MVDLSEAIEAADSDTVDEKQLQLRRDHELGYLANQYRKLARETDTAETDLSSAILENLQEQYPDEN